MTKFLTPLAIIVLINVVLLACSGKKQIAITDTANDSVPVKTIPLGKTPSQLSLQASGQLTTDDETYLSFKTGGVIRSVNVKEGDAIRTGQVLATLDLTEIKAQVAQARFSAEKAQRDFSRISRLYKDSVATLEQFQNSQTTLAIAQQQLDAAYFNLSFSEIRALSNGYVLRKFVSAGQVITSGTPVLLTNGAGSGNWVIRCSVSDRNWAAISVNDAASIALDAFPAQKFNGTITRKSEGSDAATGSFSIEVTLAKTNHKNLAAGMFGKVTITPLHCADTWTIPYDALLDGDGGGGYVFVTNDNRIAHKVPVKIGLITRDRIQVISGLENATFLIVSGNAYLNDSSAIRIVR